MVLVEAAVVIGLVWLIVYGTIRLLGSPQHQPADPPDEATVPSRWRTNHYDLKGETHVVVQRVSERGGKVLDEHVVAIVPVDDPDYDARFLAAMTTARERRALFEAEEND